MSARRVYALRALAENTTRYRKHRNVHPTTSTNLVANRCRQYDCTGLTRLNMIVKIMIVFHLTL